MRTQRTKQYRERQPLALTVIQEAIASTFDDDERVEAVILFGSCVRGRMRGCSDVDMAVLPAPSKDGYPNAWELRDTWRESLSRRLDNYPIDVVVLAPGPLLVRWNVAREGRLLLERRPGAWRQFQRRTLSEWRDRARARERFWRRFLRRWEEVGFGERYGDHTAALDAMRRIRTPVA